jgi:two-component system, NarL family, nitrate/nitrite response regulator NarL
MTGVRVLVVADVRFYREGIAGALQADERIEVVGRDRESHDALALAAELQPDVALVDVSGPAGCTLARALLVHAPDTKVVALGVSEVDDEVMPLIEAGVSGYVTRDSSLDDVTLAVKGVADGGPLCSPRMVGSFLRRIAALSAGLHPERMDAQLTSREVEIVQLIDRGLSNKQIARELCIELPTVKNHVHHILEKLGVRRRGEAAAKFRNGRELAGRASVAD